MQLLRRFPCVGGRSSCGCSRWQTSSWSGWSWKLAWALVLPRGNTRCWDCGASVPLRAWAISSLPYTTWIYLVVPSCCRKAWRSCSGSLNRCIVWLQAQTMVSVGQCRTPDLEAAPGDTSSLQWETTVLQPWTEVQRTRNFKFPERT